MRDGREKRESQKERAKERERFLERGSEELEGRGGERKVKRMRVREREQRR